MPYGEFGKLRFLDFLPKISHYSIEEDGCVETRLGLACSEGSLLTCFLWRPHSTQTAAIALDFDSDCPEEAGNALLQYLGLNIRKGMRYEDVKQALGTPVKDFGPPGARGGAAEVPFIVGSVWPYYLDCYLTETGGLSRVWIARKDLVDEFDHWKSSV